MTGSAAASLARGARRLLPTLLFAALAAYTVARSALRFPFADDFDLAVGQWPPSAAWLWAQHNEHRLPLPKLLVAWCARHGDFRVGPWLSLALLTAACAWLVARLGRDRPLVCVLAPALLLNPESNAWRWDVELQFATCVALVVVALTEALTARRARDAIVLAIASLLLPLTGGNGVLFSGATALAAVVLARDTSLPARARAIFAAAAIGTLAVDAAWLHDWTRPAGDAAIAAGSLAEGAAIAARLAVAPLGSLAERAPVALALAVTVAGLAVAATSPIARRAIAALFAAGTLAVLVVIAASRAGRGWIVGLEAHYGLVIAPAYLVAILAARPSRLEPAAAALAVIACVAAVPTTTRE
ncbi:MAG TPA: hypothetical protein VF334_03515, partial [Polyangia bacterium]